MLKHFQSNSYLFGGNAAYIEELYETYLDNPASVAEYWRDYFDALQNIYAANGARVNDIAHAPIIESFAQRAKHPAQPVRAGGLATAHKQVHVQTLIGATVFWARAGRISIRSDFRNVRRFPIWTPRFTVYPKRIWNRDFMQPICILALSRPRCVKSFRRCAIRTAEQSAPNLCT